MLRNKQKIKYTAVLPNEYVLELKELVAKKYIPSVNIGICLAIKRFIVESKSEFYQRQMESAAKNKQFINRTMKTQETFINVDNKMGEEW